MTLNNRLNLVCLYGSLCLILAGCGAGVNNPPVTGVSPAGLTADGFEARVTGSSSPLALRTAVEPGQGQTTLHVAVDQEATLPALLFEVGYDATRYTPLAAQFNPLIAGDDVITLDLLQQPGSLQAGAAAVGDEQLEISAGLNVLTVLFRNEPVSQSRSASLVPANANSLCPLSWNADTSTLSWLYTNPGDYDQNGEVGISDLQPLALHFGESGPFATSSAQFVIDGNNDGEISLADLNLIAVNYGNTVEGYNLFGSEDFSNVPVGFSDPSLIDPLTGYTLDAAAGAPAVDRLSFSHTLETVLTDGFYWVRPYVTLSDETVEEGTRSNFNGGRLSTGVPGGFNLVPVADLTLDFEGDIAPVVVSLDASASFDPDGSIAFYEWDFEGDGLFDALGETPMISHNYSQPGTYAPLVRVTDNEGSWDVFQTPEFVLTQQVGPSNIPPVADLLATVATGDAPLTVGFIASGSHDVDGTVTGFRWDFDGNGSYELMSGAHSTVLHTYDTPGTYNATVSVADDDGATDTDSVTIEVIDPDIPGVKPIILVQISPSFGQSPLNVTITTNGSNDPDGEIVRFDYDFNNDGFWEAYDAGPTVNVALIETGPRTIRVRGTDNDGDQKVGQAGAFVTNPTVNPPNAVLNVTVPDQPAPVMVDIDATATTKGDGNIIRFDFDLDGDGIFELIDAPEQFSWEFTEGGEHNLRVRVTDDENAVDIAGAVANIQGVEHLDLGDLGNSNAYLSIHAITGFPAIAYFDAINQNLNYLLADDGTGVENWEGLVVDETGDVGRHCSLFKVDDRPAIAYYDKDNSALKYAVSDTLKGLETWTIVTVEDTAFNTGLYCELSWMSNGSISAPGIAYYDSTNLDIRYAICDDTYGLGTWSSTVVATASIFPDSMSLVPVTISGQIRPAICAISGVGELLYYSADTQGGQGSWSLNVIDASISHGGVASMAIADGNPAIAYLSGSSHLLKYARANATSGRTTWSFDTVDDVGDPWQYCALNWHNGVPRIAYWEDTGNVSLAVSDTTTGIGNWSLIPIALTGQTSGHVGVLGTGGSVGVIYNNAVKRRLEYAFVH